MMKNESKTLYIPLYGKAFVSKKGVILSDKKAEEIWEKERFPLKRKSSSKWLAYFMGMRAAVFDRWTEEKLLEKPDTVVVHLGCGLDSRAERINVPFEKWFDADLPDVIEVRKQYYSESQNYKMLKTSAEDTEWVNELPDFENAVLIMEGLSMYLSEKTVKEIFAAFSSKFKNTEIIMDAYTTFAVKAGKAKNPINDVGAGANFGIDEPKIFENGKTVFKGELCMTPENLINELSGFEKAFFKAMFSGSFAKRLYKIYTYKT